MLRSLLAMTAFAAVAAAPPQPAPAAAPPLQLARASAAVENTAGEPQFVIRDLAYLAELGGSAVPAADAYDRATRRVRVTPAGRAALWLRCADLVPTATVCRRSGTGPVRDEQDGEAVGLGRNLPDCPGDPRCPRKGAK